MDHANDLELGEPDHPGGFTNAYLDMLISLFLIILVFFILLGAMAAQEKKQADDAPDRGNSAFATETVPQAEEQAKGSGEAVEIRGYLRLKETLEQAAPRAQVSVSVMARTMEIILLEDTLFDPGSATVKPIDKILDDVVRIAATTSRPNDKTVMEAFFCLSDPGGLNLQARRGQALSEELVRRGAPAPSLYVGLRNCPNNRIQMQFRALTASERS